MGDAQVVGAPSGRDRRRHGRGALMRRAAVGALAAAALVPGVAQAREPGIPQMLGDHPELRLTGTQPMSDRLTELTFETPYLNAPTKVRMLLPKGYGETSREYGVLYLLHGCCDDWRSWTDKGAAEALTENYDMIVVMPDAGSDGWYSDWFNGGEWGNPRWESYHIGQLVPWIDSHFRTIRQRSGRAVAGLSMGGFGTMSYAARHPDVFGFAASFSGAVDSSAPGNLGSAAAWGSRAQHEARWEAHNPGALVGNLDDTELQLRSGNGAPGIEDTQNPNVVLPFIAAVETACYVASRSLHDKLTAQSIAHLWEDRGYGTHDWPYWQRDLRLTLPAAQDLFDDGAPAPRKFDFRAAEPDFGIYGWTVRMDRDDLAWLQLSGVTQTGLRVTGSGTGRITTPPQYERNGRYAVEVVDPATGTATTIDTRADHDGRLVLPLDLGASTGTRTLRIASAR